MGSVLGKFGGRGLGGLENSPSKRQRYGGCDPPASLYDATRDYSIPKAGIESWSMPSARTHVA